MSGDRILVVDDEVDLRNLAKIILEKRRYQVVLASSGEEALRKADVEKPDLILLDIVMSGMSGYEVCKTLKEQQKTCFIPVVMFTALGRDVDRRMSEEARADGHFTKPFTPERLQQEVREYLEEAGKEKFSKHLGLEHRQLRGKKILLEFDPSTPYERLVRDFTVECASHNETVIVLTKGRSAIHQAIEGDEGIETIDLITQTMLSPILKEHPEEPLSLVYDNLTDLTLSTSFQSAYGFIQNALKQLSDPRITALFPINSSAHEQREVYSLRGLFSNQVVYGKEGITNVKLA